MLDVADFTTSVAPPGFGNLGICQVRYGKAKRGGRTRWRAAATVCRGRQGL